MPLVVTRRQGEEVIVRDHLGNYVGRVYLASVKGERVRIAFELPDSFELQRREIDEAKYPAPQRFAGIAAVTKAASPRATATPRDTRTPAHIRARRRGGAA